MTNQVKKDKILNKQQLADTDTSDCPRSNKSYETPKLLCYGDVRDVTLGGTFGTGESGAGFTFLRNE